MNSAMSLQRCLERLAQCTGNHEQCGFGDVSAVPTRLVDVIKCAPDAVLVERLHGSARYVCVNHCWGQNNGKAATTKSLKSYKKKIPIAFLPLTFMDAVEFVRRLDLGVSGSIRHALFRSEI